MHQYRIGIMMHSNTQIFQIAISYGYREPPAKLEGTYIDAYNMIKLLGSCEHINLFARRLI
jgi:hypothetical protein